MQKVDIQVKGRFDTNGVNRLFNMRSTPTVEGNTVLSGPIRDHAELQGILSYLSNLGLELISVNRMVE